MQAANYYIYIYSLFRNISAVWTHYGICGRKRLFPEVRGSIPTTIIAFSRKKHFIFFHCVFFRLFYRLKDALFFHPLAFAPVNKEESNKLIRNVVIQVADVAKINTQKTNWKRMFSLSGTGWTKIHKFPYIFLRMSEDPFFCFFFQVGGGNEPSPVSSGFFLKPPLSDHDGKKKMRKYNFLSP